MNFFEYQERAQKRTKKLVLFFVLAVVAIITAIYLVAAAMFGVSGMTRYGGRINWWNPELLAAVAGVVMMIILLGSLWKTYQLRQGGGAVARMLGGVPVAPNTNDADERKLMNVVEEMAIASGTPVPEVYLLPNESAINAFAAGFTPSDAAIGVTQGSIEKLGRDELQGVIAHEFSHILHGDMRLNIRLMGILNGILVIGLAGYFMMRVMGIGAGSRGGRRGGGRGGGGAILAIFLVGLTMMLVGFIGVFFGRLIKAAVSRQREYLADASAVQFTRNPSGLAGALKKIGGFVSGAQIVHRRAEEASHLFFGNSRRKRFLLNSLMATHPPLPDRIRAIEPDFDGEFEAIGSDFHAIEGPAAGLAPGAAVSATAPPADPIETTPDRLVAQVGAPTRDHVAYGAALLESLPEVVRDAAREPFGAQAVIFCLLLDRDPTIRDQQLAALEKSAATPAYRETQHLAPHIAALGPHARLPLVDISLPALRQHSRTQFEAFRRNVQVLIEADQKLDLFEFTLQKALLRHLRATYDPKPTVAQYHSVNALRNECGVLLSTIAYAGHSTLEEAQAAFQSAASHLYPQGPELTPSPPEAVTLPTFDYALDRANASSLAVKRRILEACAHCVAFDGRVTVAEGELLRAVADGLDAPMPPVLVGRG